MKNKSRIIKIILLIFSLLAVYYLITNPTARMIFH